MSSVLSSKFDSEVSEPFNPKSISIETRVFLIQTIINRLKQGTLRLSPNFQRKIVWDRRRQSRLIESILLKIPLPMFYVAADEYGNLDVVDGMQRLSTLRDFIFHRGDPKLEPNGQGFKLDDLEFITDLKNKQFKEIGVFYQNRILETELSFTIINPGTPEDVKFTIFSRVNTGGMPLTEQEVRHALYNGESTKLLAELSENDEFLEATNGTINKDRMEDHETILRMLAFMVRDYSLFPGKGNKITNFLAETMMIINSMPDFSSPRFKRVFNNDDIKHIRIKTIAELKSKFSLGMRRAYKIFGDHAFRRSLPGQSKTKINKSLFDTWGSCLAALDKELFAAINKQTLLYKYGALLKTKTFTDCISRYANTPEHTKARFKSITEIINSSTRG